MTFFKMIFSEDQISSLWVKLWEEDFKILIWSLISEIWEEIFKVEVILKVYLRVPLLSKIIR